MLPFAPLRPITWPLPDDVARLHVDVAQVRVEGHVVDAVVDHDAEAVAGGVPARVDHLAPIGSVHLRPERHGDVERHVPRPRALRNPTTFDRPDEVPVAVRPILVRASRPTGPTAG